MGARNSSDRTSGDLKPRRRTKQQLDILRTPTYPAPPMPPERPPVKGRYSVVRYVEGRREIVSHGFRDADEAASLARRFMEDPDRRNRDLFVAVEYASHSGIPSGAPPHKPMPIKKRKVRRKKYQSGYIVSRVQPPHYVVIASGLPTFEAAWEEARPRVRANIHDDVLYFVEWRGLAIAVSDTPYSPADLPEEDEDDKYPWELEDWHGDMSLLARYGDELGLGIPAQWGKGRRSRKGDYIT
jgi:hypothetical protein